jgi:hypothetical protein
VSVNWENGRTSVEMLATRAVGEFFKTLGRDQYQVVQTLFIQNQEIWIHHNALEENWLGSKRLPKETINIRMLWHGR